MEEVFLIGGPLHGRVVKSERCKWLEYSAAISYDVVPEGHQTQRTDKFRYMFINACRSTHRQVAVYSEDVQRFFELVICQSQKGDLQSWLEFMPVKHISQETKKAFGLDTE